MVPLRTKDNGGKSGGEVDRALVGRVKDYKAYSAQMS